MDGFRIRYSSQAGSFAELLEKWVTSPAWSRNWLRPTSKTPTYKHNLHTFSICRKSRRTKREEKGGGITNNVRLTIAITPATRSTCRHPMNDCQARKHFPKEEPVFYPSQYKLWLSNFAEKVATNKNADFERQERAIYNWVWHFFKTTLSLKFHLQCKAGWQANLFLQSKQGYLNERSVTDTTPMYE